MKLYLHRFIHHIDRLPDLGAEVHQVQPDTQAMATPPT
jgi:hypothetical protein